MLPAAPTISLETQRELRARWHEANAWLAAANGFNPAYLDPVARLLARDWSHVSLGLYFDAIEQAMKETS